MNREDIRLLYEYDRWANGRVLSAAATLSTEEFARDLGGSFPSVRDTLLHILSGEWGWLEYWKKPSEVAGDLLKLRKRRDELFDPKRYADVAAVQGRWAEVENEVADFVNGVTEEELEQELPVRNMTIKLIHLMQHVANHSTYHRGQIAMMMRQLGKGPVATDFHVFLMEGKQRSL